MLQRLSLQAPMYIPHVPCWPKWFLTLRRSRCFDLWCFTTTKIQFQPALHASDLPRKWDKLIAIYSRISPLSLSCSFNRRHNSHPRLGWIQYLSDTSVFQSIQQNRQADANRKACREQWERQKTMCMFDDVRNIENLPPPVWLLLYFGLWSKPCTVWYTYCRDIKGFDNTSHR